MSRLTFLVAVAIQVAALDMGSAAAIPLNLHATRSHFVADAFNPIVLAQAAAPAATPRVEAPQAVRTADALLPLAIPVPPVNLDLGQLDPCKYLLEQEKKKFEALCGGFAMFDAPDEYYRSYEKQFAHFTEQDWKRGYLKYHLNFGRGEAYVKDVTALLNAKMDQLHSPLYQIQMKALIRRYELEIERADYESSKFAIIKGLFEWQDANSNILLALVILVVLCGVAFSAFELWSGARKFHRPVGYDSGRAAEPSPDHPSATELEISAAKIKLTSSVIGVIVLALSIAFLYLYIHEVYNIRPVNLG